MVRGKLMDSFNTDFRLIPRYPTGCTTHMRTTSLTPLLVAFVLQCGCAQKSPPTLTVHVHDGAFDFIDHAGTKVQTATNIEDFDVIARKPEIQNLIHEHCIVLRYACVDDANEFNVPDDVDAAMEHLFATGVTSVMVDYTN